MAGFDNSVILTSITKVVDTPRYHMPSLWLPFEEYSGGNLCAQSPTRPKRPVSLELSGFHVDVLVVLPFVSSTNQ